MGEVNGARVAQSRSRRWWLAGAAVVAASFAVGVVTRARSSGALRAPPIKAEPSPSARSQSAAHTAAVGGGEIAGRGAAGAARPPVPDAVTQARALGVPVPQLFDQEGRDEAWATAVEFAATDSYTAVLSAVAPWAARVAVECRTTLCKVVLPVDESKAQATTNRLQVVSIAAGVSPFAEQGDDGQWYAGVYVLFDGTERAPAMQSKYWTDGVKARFPGGNAQIAAWLDQDDRRAGEDERRRTSAAQ